jgi:hypothetical protein
MIDTLQHEPVALPARSFARVTLSVLGYALLMAVMFFTPLNVFVPAAIFACGVRNGKTATIAPVVFAALTYLSVHTAAVNIVHIPPADAMLDLAWLFTLIAAISLPSFIALPLVERGEEFGPVLITSTIASVAGYIATEWIMRRLYGFSALHELTTRSSQTFLTWGVTQSDIDKMRPALVVLPSVMMAVTVVCFVLSLVMYGRLKAWRDLITRRRIPDAEIAVAPPQYLFRHLSLPDWFLFAFVLCGVTPLVSGVYQKVMLNVLVMVVFLYVLQGLAIFRWFLVALDLGVGGVMFAFLILGLLSTPRLFVSPYLLGIAGLFDAFFDFRHLRRKDSPDESHPH